MVVTLVRVPQAAPEQPVPESDQVTPLFCESFCSVAAKGEDCDTCTEAEGGFTETEIGGGVVMVMAAVPDLVASVMDVAVRVTDAGFGAVAGAL